MIPEIGKTYKHFKGHIYKIISIGRHSETLEDLIVYQNTENGDVWIRPYEMWSELVDKEKYPEIEQKYRFELIKEQD